jgi:hypothetical protein
MLPKIKKLLKNGHRSARNAAAKRTLLAQLTELLGEANVTFTRAPRGGKMKLTVTFMTEEGPLELHTFQAVLSHISDNLVPVKVVS